MGKQRREQPQDSIFANNPFLDGLFDWMDSPEGQQSIAVRDVLCKLLEDVQLDAKQRKLIWPDRERLDLEQSIQRVRKKYPDFPRDEVEEFLLDWIDMGYDPQNYSQAQLDELDSLTERWVADHLRKAKAPKKQKSFTIAPRPKKQPTRTPRIFLSNARPNFGSLPGSRSIQSSPSPSTLSFSATGGLKDRAFSNFSSAKPLLIKKIFA